MSSETKKLGLLFRARKYLSPANLHILYVFQVRLNFECCSYIWRLAPPTFFHLLERLRSYVPVHCQGYRITYPRMFLHLPQIFSCLNPGITTVLPPQLQMNSFHYPITQTPKCVTFTCMLFDISQSVHNFLISSLK